MIAQKEFPILEFDACRQAKIEPDNIKNKIDCPKACVITFFGEVIQNKADANLLKKIASINTATIRIPVYETFYGDERVGLVLGYVGGPGASGELEELIAMGFEKFIVCGGAGVLRRDIQVGHLIVPYSAIRDEGTSFHYVEPSYEVACNARALSAIEECLNSENIPYIKSKTWTTDAPYRETNDKIALRVSQCCVTVEMEAAAFFAVAQFRNVVLGQILYGGDDLSGVEWDQRRWVSRDEIRRNLVELCFKIALKL